LACIIVSGTVARMFASRSLLGIVRFHGGGDVAGAVGALLRGGIDLVEVTLDTPGALEVIESAGGTVGAGTVVSAEQVRAAAAAGARFVVSPGFVPEVVATALELGIEPVPGVFTATEILAARAAGARVLKLFPVSVGGPRYVRAMRGPFPDVPFVVTGGVKPEEIGSYFDAGATVVALGSELVGRIAPASDAELEQIVARAEAAR
jgi:2-dehydro-3-deoxyphosphogluconate aldolase/(4S)-4-hydroxy-2-oxoglutarate aldolase